MRELYEASYALRPGLWIRVKEELTNPIICDIVAGQNPQVDYWNGLPDTETKIRFAKDMKTFDRRKLTVPVGEISAEAQAKGEDGRERALIEMQIDWTKKFVRSRLRFCRVYMKLA